MFGLISWLQLSEDANVNNAMRVALRETPTHKWVPLVHQLASRLSGSDSQFQEVRREAAAVELGPGSKR